MNWLYDKKLITQESPIIQDYCGFVYNIINLRTGQMYIGKKMLWQERKLPLKKNRVNREHRVYPTNWEDYWSSCKPLLKDVEKFGKKRFRREILSFHENKTELNYAELCEQIIRNVLDELFDDGEKVYYNENVARVFYPSKSFGEKRCTLHETRLRNEK